MTRAHDVAGIGGSRLLWDEMPPEVRAAIEERMGGRVAEARSQAGGFSPGVAARVRLDDGRRLFVKAACSQPNADTPRAHRRGIDIAARLPEAAPAARLRAHYDDGEWVALVFDDIDGRPPTLPWDPDEVARVLDAVEELGARLTPSPIDARAVPDAHAETFAGWERLAADPARLGAEEAWVRDNIDRLVDASRGWQEAGRGETLLHSDLRADNVLLTDDRVYVVDWAHACVGARWLELMWMLPSIAMQGGPDPWEVFDAHPVGRAADPEHVTQMLVVFAGYFVDAWSRPAPPGLPTLRAFQRAQGARALAWLRRRPGWS